MEPSPGESLDESPVMRAKSARLSRRRAATVSDGATGNASTTVPANRQHHRHRQYRHRLQALVDGQSRVLDMIVRGLPLAQTLDAVANWVEAESRDGVLASLLLVDSEGQHLLHGAAPSLPQTYNDAIHGIQIGPAVGSCGTAAFTGHPVIVEDIAVDPLWADFRPLALAHDLRACWSTPLIGRTGRVLGTFAMYYRQPRRPTADDRHIIQLVTQTAVLAIEHQQIEEERRRAEAASAHLAAIVTSAEDAIASKTLEGVVTSWNASAERMFGYSASEMIGQPILRLFPPDRRDEEDVILARIRAGERIEHFETVRVAKDGRELEVSLTISPIRDAAGTVIGASKIVRDMTVRRRLERRTREALDALIEVAAAMVSDPIEDEQILERNDIPGSALPNDNALRRFAVLCGRVLACEQIAIVAIEPGTDLLRTIAVTGTTTTQEQRFRSGFAHLRLADRFGPDVAAHLFAGETVLIDVNHLPSDDPAHILSKRYFLLAPMGAAGTLQGYIGVNFGDLLDNYTAENRALALAVAQLIGTVMERARLSRERAEARSREAALAESKRHMDEFLGIASHELRTPLTSITANVQLARRQLRLLPTAGNTTTPDAASQNEQTGRPSAAPGGRADQLLERTEHQLRRLDRLVGDLLDVSRIQAGKLELRLEPCDLRAIVRDGVEAQRIAWPDRAITLDLPPDDAPVLLDADPDRISQVMTNFLTNALKYSAPDQPVAVRVSTQSSSAGQGKSGQSDVMARVEVSDRGPGLSAEQQAHLFERFYRVPGIEQQAGSGVGLGLGLYICKTIVERHGGAIGVTSAPGAGSTFWYTLPVHSAIAD